MDLVSMLLLCLTVVLSAGRNILSKSISGAVFGTRDFFLAQATIFGCGSVALLLFGGVSGAAIPADAAITMGAAIPADAAVTMGAATTVGAATTAGEAVNASAVVAAGAAITAVAPLTLVYALIYGVLLVSAQWCYTVALKDGNTAICSTVYSLGFIFPTMSGAIFWQESLTVLNMVGILCVIPAIVISGMKAPKNRSGAPEEKLSRGEKVSQEEKVPQDGLEKAQYIFPLLIAMLSSGGLGIMQKVQQSSPYPDQKSIFVLVAFIFACVVSAVCGVVVKPGDAQKKSEQQDIAKPGNAPQRCGRQDIAKSGDTQKRGGRQDIAKPGNAPQSSEWQTAKRLRNGQQGAEQQCGDRQERAKRDSNTQRSKLPNKRLLYSGGVGICFGCCNLLNTTLAGRLDSAVFFPVNNISVILLSMILSVIIFKEKIRKKEVAVLLLGIMSILLLTS